MAGGHLGQSIRQPVDGAVGVIESAVGVVGDGGDESIFFLGFQRIHIEKGTEQESAYQTLISGFTATFLTDETLNWFGGLNRIEE